MKVLFTGYHNPHFPTITEYVERAFTKEGHECFPFDDRQYLFPGRIRSAVTIFEKWDLRRMNNKLIKLAKSIKPDVCFVSGGHRIFPSTIKKMKKMGIKTALWTIDAPTNFAPILAAAPHYDVVFCGGTEAVDLLESNNINGAHWLPFGYDDQLDQQIVCSDQEREELENDIVFVGSYYPNRLKILEELLDFDIAVWGPGWDNIPNDSLLREVIEPVQLLPDDWKKIYYVSKIVIVLHYQDGKTPCNQVSPKLYEALACGQFVLCDRQKDAEILFEDGQHLVFFNDIDDLKEKIRFYLEYDDIRTQIALAGKNEVQKNHSYRHRIEKIVKTFNEI